MLINIISNFICIAQLTADSITEQLYTGPSVGRRKKLRGRKLETKPKRICLLLGENKIAGKPLTYRVRSPTSAKTASKRIYISFPNGPNKTLSIRLTLMLACVPI